MSVKTLSYDAATKSFLVTTADGRTEQLAESELPADVRAAFANAIPKVASAADTKAEAAVQAALKDPQYLTLQVAEIAAERQRLARELQDGEAKLGQLTRASRQTESALAKSQEALAKAEAERVQVMADLNVMRPTLEKAKAEQTRAEAVIQAAEEAERKLHQIELAAQRAEDRLAHAEKERANVNAEIETKRGEADKWNDAFRQKKGESLALDDEIAKKRADLGGKA